MEITKHGIVAICEDEIVVTGFEVDGSSPNAWLPIGAEDLIITWAIERLTEVRLKRYLHDNQG